MVGDAVTNIADDVTGRILARLKTMQVTAVAYAIAGVSFVIVLSFISVAIFLVLSAQIGPAPAAFAVAAIVFSTGLVVLFAAFAFAQFHNGPKIEPKKAFKAEAASVVDKIGGVGLVLAAAGAGALLASRLNSDDEATERSSLASLVSPAVTLLTALSSMRASGGAEAVGEGNIQHSS